MSPGVTIDAPDAAALPAPAGVDESERRENFSVVPRLLGAAERRSLRAVYRFARFVDDLGDEAPGDRQALLDSARTELGRAFTGAPTHPVFRELAAALAVRPLPREPFERLIAANEVDQRRPTYDTYRDLLAYCELSANPVGELVLHVFRVATPERVRLSDDVCTALQLVEHWQDVGEDARRGRIYLPRDDRESYGVAEADLVAPEATAALRELLRLETERAEILLRSGSRLVAELRGAARVAVAGYVAGGLAAVAALRRCEFDVLRHRARVRRGRRLALALAVLAGARP